MSEFSPGSPNPEGPRKNIYEHAAEVRDGMSAEANRLRSVTWPAEVSEQVLESLVSGKSVLDVGSGENVELNRLVTERGGKYVAADVRNTALQEQMEAGAVGAVVATAETLPFGDESVDVVHSRFVLGWLQPEARSRAIGEDLRVAKEAAVLLDYDWSAMGGTSNIERLRDAAVALARIQGFDPLYGSKLAEEVGAAADEGWEVEARRFSRPADNYYSELLTNLGPMAKGARQRLGDREEVVELEGALNSVILDSQSEDPHKFTTPDIVAVKASRNL